MPKPVITREPACLDVDEALTCYINEGATTAAVGMVDALEKA